MYTVLIRNAGGPDLCELAQLWFDGWQDAHTGIVPEELRIARTVESFRQRLAEAISNVRVAEVKGELAGFVIIKDDELYQFYVARVSRSTGVAPALMQEALNLLRGNGAVLGWLHCAIGNERAARFYEKSGWRRADVVTSHLSTPTGNVALNVWRFETSLSSNAHC